MDSKPNRRSKPRLQVTVPVRVKTHDKEPELEAQTRDISTNGLFLYTDSPLAEGANVELVLILPPELNSGQKAWVCCQARILRVENAGTRFGVAAAIERMNFLPEIPA
jgi:hypothetical protein